MILDLCLHAIIEALGVMRQWLIIEEKPDAQNYRNSSKYKYSLHFKEYFLKLAYFRMADSTFQ